MKLMNRETGLKSASEAAVKNESAAASSCPWVALDAEGTSLTVDHFITTMLSQTSNALRRTITQPYADQFGLRGSEWRLLSLLAHTPEMPFAKLVAQSTSDKALVSRTLRLMEKRGLVVLQADGPTPRKKLTCTITAQGLALHAQVIPVARQSQAEVIGLLTPQERLVLHGALHKLYLHCTAPSQSPVTFEKHTN
jgi:DNA-binding MarR family transcriptional regulator